MSEFIHNLARGRPSARRLLVFYQVSPAVAEENCRKEKYKALFKRRSLSTELNTYLGRPK